MQKPYIIVVVGFLVLFNVFRRIRRNIGWQKLNSGKMRARIVLFLIIGLVFMLSGISHPVSLLSDAAGILLGAFLAYYGADKTNFEEREGNWFYKPNTWIGSSVIAIFFGRLVYKFYEVYSLLEINGLQGGQIQAGGLNNFANNPSNTWTTGLMLIMFAYYCTYYFILLRKEKQLIRGL